MEKDDDAQEQKQRKKKELARLRQLRRRKRLQEEKDIPLETSHNQPGSSALISTKLNGMHIKVKLIEKCTKPTFHCTPLY